MKKQCTVPFFLAAGLLALAVVGGVASWVVFRAGSYQKLLTVQSGDFSSEIAEVAYDRIPMLDKDSAGSSATASSASFPTWSPSSRSLRDYTQINYHGRPVRVTPLRYGDIIKWFNNRSAGLPAYLIIDMVDQSVDVVRLDEGMKYTTAEHFSRNLYRHLRFQYPTFMFEEPVFEIDEDGTPYWVCAKKEKTIGLFGGTDNNGAVLVNAVTGESEYLTEPPEWVDHVYSAELIIEQYDYYGMYHNGFINSILGQRDVTVTTDGYNYIAEGDDVYLYTGVTSVGGDESNVGFLLSNQRTKETKYYPCAGATEYSAMDSAEGSGPEPALHGDLPAAPERCRAADLLHGAQGRERAREDVRYGQRQPVPDRRHRRDRRRVRVELPSDAPAEQSDLGRSDRHRPAGRDRPPLA